jgi:hypothetical protein
MPYLVDGHNLIPKLGLRLDALDDENELIERLQEFCRLSRKQVEVYFDGAQPGQAAARKFGAVTAHFVRRPQIADEAIRLRLKQLGNAAKNWVVVSGDHRVQSEAKAARAAFIDSSTFAQQISAALRAGDAQPTAKNKLSQPEVDEWLKTFGGEE